MITIRPFIKELSNFLDNDYFDDFRKYRRRFEVDIVEIEDALQIHAILPGISKEDIRIELQDNTLVISGELKNPFKIEEGQFNRIERSFGEFSRSFNIAERFDVEKITAKQENGILVLNIPRKEEQKIEIRTIEIQ